MATNSSKRVLITGASGLLGRAVLEAFIAAGWHSTGLAFSRADRHPNLVKADLCDPVAMEKLIDDLKPNVIVHCAAERSPDAVDQKPAETFQLNVQSTQHLSQCAKNVGAFLLYISTDYVFDGNAPPYTEDATPHPINKYGESKLAGEEAAVSVYPDAVILRVPVLYGPVEKLSESAVTVLFEKLLEGPTGKPAVMSHYERRYPTHVADIAKALVLLATLKLQGEEIRGVYHWSGKDCLTKYEMVQHMSKIFGLPMDHVVADATKPTSGAARPYDAALSCSRLEKLGAPTPMSFADGISSVLSPFARKA
ncbi:methionine adenosyltransferase 2 subunit beta-like [Paramacrobiotus metropolitanus]|uniref:methionine adenosyltransferase 2 subunit beta-like n=1 Tax=Paramacrobiotus metropolitanus TaxID=2943436 RepID=UPI002445A722|nr:methionine adenosyltransferase 2 subunit beta-like [Paramacrobiotus metropolitanus]